MWKIFMLGKYSEILAADDTEWYYFVRFDITKPHRNNETGTKYQHSYMSMYCIICNDQ